jgi:hypothetical protein
MPTLPSGSIETESDAELAGCHAHGLSWVEERAAAACALNFDDATVAEALSVAEGTVRGQRHRSVHRVLDGTTLQPNRVHLGRWCLFHWECCLVRVARRYEEGTWLVA